MRRWAKRFVRHRNFLRLRGLAAGVFGLLAALTVVAWAQVDDEGASLDISLKGREGEIYVTEDVRRKRTDVKQHGLWAGLEEMTDIVRREWRVLEVTFDDMVVTEIRIRRWAVWKREGDTFMDFDTDATDVSANPVAALMRQSRDAVATLTFNPAGQLIDMSVRAPNPSVERFVRQDYEQFFEAELSLYRPGREVRVGDEYSVPTKMGNVTTRRKTRVESIDGPVGRRKVVLAFERPSTDLVLGDPPRGVDSWSPPSATSRGHAIYSEAAGRVVSYEESFTVETRRIINGEATDLTVSQSSVRREIKQ